MSELGAELDGIFGSEDDRDIAPQRVFLVGEPGLGDERDDVDKDLVCEFMTWSMPHASSLLPNLKRSLSKACSLLSASVVTRPPSSLIYTPRTQVSPMDLPSATGDSTEATGCATPPPERRRSGDRTSRPAY